MRLKHPAITAVIAVTALLTAACSGAGDDAGPTSISSEAPVTTTSPVPETSSSTPTPTTSSSTTSSSVPAGPTDPLTGKKQSKNPVIAAKIDNTSFPQFGVADADIIYTEQVEGGLTRLIAVYHSTMPKEIGAVRSMRSTDMELLPSYGKIILVNSGGAPANVTRMRNSILINVTEGFNGLWRSNARRAPYNLHANLQTVAKDHQDEAPAKDIGLRFEAKDQRLTDARAVKDIDVTMIGTRTTFSYDKGRYVPAHNGTAYVDDDGADVAVDNVIVQHVTDKPDGIIDPAGNPSFLTTTVGSGDFTLYRDGKAIDGQWSRKDKTAPTTFVDDDGTEVTLKPGKTWIVLAPQTSTFNKG